MLGSKNCFETPAKSYLGNVPTKHSILASLSVNSGFGRHFNGASFLLLSCGFRMLVVILNRRSGHTNPAGEGYHVQSLQLRHK